MHPHVLRNPFQEFMVVHRPAQARSDLLPHGSTLSPGFPRQGNRQGVGCRRDEVRAASYSLSLFLPMTAKVLQSFRHAISREFVVHAKPFSQVPGGIRSYGDLSQSPCRVLTNWSAPGAAIGRSWTIRPSK